MTKKKKILKNKTLNEKNIISFFDEVTGVNEKDKNKTKFDPDLHLYIKDVNDIEYPESPTPSINDIIDFYHKKLYSNKKVNEYLENKGLKNPELLARFKLGYVDGTLLDKLSEKQINELKKLELIGKNNVEHFTGCLILPIFNKDNQVEWIYGINIDTQKIKTYSDSSKALFNQKTCKIYDEVIITNNITKALNLINIGFENTIAVNGYDGFKGEYVKILQDNRVKTIVIDFDTNDAATDLIKDILIDEYFRVKTVSIPDSFNKKQIQKLIDESETYTKIDKNESFKAIRENGFYIFHIGGVTYKLTGIKDIFVNNLSVHIKAEYEEENHHDSINLYASRARTAFANTLGAKFEIEPKRVEKDLNKILDYLEEENIKKLYPEDKHKELTDEEKVIGMKFLKSENMFQQIIDDMTTLGYVGEDLNKILLYIAASTRILDDPISVMIISEAAAGKSYLVETLRKLLPPEDVVALTSLSDQALNYIGDLLHKFLIMGEAVHNEHVEHQIRDILSNKELSRLVPIKDEKTGRNKSETIITKMIVSMVIGGTKYDNNPENASRFFIVNADESVEQTNRIHALQQEKYSLERKYLILDIIPQIIKKHRCAQKLLKKVTIINPFRKYLRFPNTNLRSRRDFERFIDLIAGVCFIRQYQKKLKNDGRFDYIECDLIDYEIAYRIMINNILPATMSDIPNAALSLYEKLRDMVSDIAKKNRIKPTEVEFIQRQLRNYTHLNKDTVKKHLKILVDNEYIHISSGKSQGTRYSYKLREDKPADKLDLSVIPTPKQMKITIEADKKDKKE